MLAIYYYDSNINIGKIFSCNKKNDHNGRFFDIIPLPILLGRFYGLFGRLGKR